MSVSQGPYLSPIPFVNIAEVQVALAPQAPHIRGTGIIRELPPQTAVQLAVTIQLANERPGGTPGWGESTPEGQIEFGNFIYLSFDEPDIREKQRNTILIRRLIKNGQGAHASSVSSKSEFILGSSDFVRGPVTIGPAAQQQSRVNTYSHTEVMNIESTYGGMPIPNLFALVVSYRREADDSITLGNICRQVILRDNKVPQRSELYRLSADGGYNYGSINTVWPGSVHPTSTGTFMAGIVHAGYDHPTVRTQDVPNTKIKDMRVLQLGDWIGPSSVDPLETRPVISNLTLSRNKTGTCHGYFAFDYTQYIKENSTLRDIMTYWPSLQNSIELKDIIIYHKKTNADGGCGLGSGDEFVRVASLGNGCQLFNASLGSSNFAIGFEDTKVRHTEGGSVQYRVELIFADKSTEVVKSLLTQLDGYLNRANNAASVPTSNRYNPIYERTITAYLELIEYLFGPQKFNPTSAFSWTKSYWHTNLMAMAYGIQEGDAERSQMLRTISGLSSRLSALINKSMVSTVTPATFKSKIYNSSREALLRFEKVFSPKLKITGPPALGISYIDDSVTKFATPVLNVSHTNYSTLLNREVDRYQIGNETAANVNLYGCLSPSFIGLGYNNIVNVGGSINQPTSDAFLSYLNGRLEKKLVPDSQSQTDVSAKKLSTLSLQGVSAARLTIPLSKEVLTPGLVNPPTLPASDYLSPTSQFYIANLLEADASGSQRSPLRLSRREDLTNSALVDTLVDAGATNNNAPPTSLNNSDLLTGFLPYIKTQQDPYVLGFDPVAVLCNFGFIGRVEYLESYSTSNGVQDPVWKTLDDRRGQLNPIICRITKMTTLPETPLSHLQPLASLFILGSLQTVTPPVFTPPDISITTLEPLLPDIADLGEEILYAKNISSDWGIWAEIDPQGTATTQGHRLRY